MTADSLIPQIRCKNFLVREFPIWYSNFIQMKSWVQDEI